MSIFNGLRTETPPYKTQEWDTVAMHRRKIENKWKIIFHTKKKYDVSNLDSEKMHINAQSTNRRMNCNRNKHSTLIVNAIMEWLKCCSQIDVQAIDMAKQKKKLNSNQNVLLITAWKWPTNLVDTNKNWNNLCRVNWQICLKFRLIDHLWYAVLTQFPNNLYGLEDKRQVLCSEWVHKQHKKCVITCNGRTDIEQLNNHNRIISLINQSPCDYLLYPLVTNWILY